MLNSSYSSINFSSPSAGSIIALIIALLLIVVSGFVSASEIAFFSLSPTDTKSINRGSSIRDAKARFLLKDSERLLATLLIANNMVNVAIILLLDLFFGHIVDFGTAEWVEFVVLTVLLTFILLLFGEIIPKLYSSNNSLSFSRKASPMLTVLVLLLKPLSSVLMKSTIVANRLVVKKNYKISVDELEHALELTDSNEISAEQEMLEGVIKFGDETVVEIMTSRLDMVALDINSSYQEVMKCVVENIYSRVPVYSDTSDNIKGILYIKDLIPYLDKGESFRWQFLIRPAFFVPETRKLDDLLHDFKTNRVHMAIVVDEFGGTSGLVTLEDVIEEILGEINDEFDDENSLYKKIGQGKYVFEGKTPLPDFFRIMDIDEDEYSSVIGEAETIAGLLLELKGDFPKKDEEIRCMDITFKVLEKKEHRMSRILVTLRTRKTNEKKRDASN